MKPTFQNEKRPEDSRSTGRSKNFKLKIVVEILSKMFMEHKAYFKLKFFSTIDFFGLFIVRCWRRSLERRIDFNHFDQGLSQKIDLAHDTEDLWGVSR